MTNLWILWLNYLKGVGEGCTHNTFKKTVLKKICLLDIRLYDICLPFAVSMLDVFLQNGAPCTPVVPRLIRLHQAPVVAVVGAVSDGLVETAQTKKSFNM